MTNEAIVTVAGYIATEPAYSKNTGGSPMLKMRLAWTPRRFDRVTNQWQDQASCFVWVKCWRRIAENANFCLNKGDAVVVSGSLTVTEYLSKEGTRRTSVDITATSIGHDLSRGISSFRRQRQSDERTTPDPDSGQESAATESDRPEDLGPTADQDSLDPAEAGELAVGDLEVDDLEAADAGLADAGLADTGLADTGLRASPLADEDEELEPASAR
jgi:single-strand DNA-binding protein